ARPRVERASRRHAAVIAIGDVSRPSAAARREPAVANREQVLVGEVVEEPTRLVEACREVAEETAEARHGRALGGGAVPPRPEPLQQARRAPFARELLDLVEGWTWPGGNG